MTQRYFLNYMSSSLRFISFSFKFINAVFTWFTHVPCFRLQGKIESIKFLWKLKVWWIFTRLYSVISREGSFTHFHHRANPKSQNFLQYLWFSFLRENWFVWKRNWNNSSQVQKKIQYSKIRWTGLPFFRVSDDGPTSSADNCTIKWKGIEYFGADMGGNSVSLDVSLLETFWHMVP